MAYRNYDDLSLAPGNTAKMLTINGPSVELPDASYVKDAAITRDGADLVLDAPHGTITIDGYFSASETPDLVAPNGETLTPELVNSFARSPAQYAQNLSISDESPVGSVGEIAGDATITRLDGSVEPITAGTPVYQGDIIETAANGAVNIAFIDDTTFAVSEDARLAIDEYVYDPATESGTQDFSVLKGMFVFTSGLIGRDDPDDVNISTPSGSIGIRGTIIAGDVNTGEITVVEGAIVVRDLSGNEMTLANQFETAKIDPVGGQIENIGQLQPEDVSNRFSGVARVSPTLFSSINDSATEQGLQNQTAPLDQSVDKQPEQPGENFDADASVDQNNDGEVDGTVNEETDAAPDNGAEDMVADEGEQQSLLTDEPVLQPKPAPTTTTSSLTGASTMTATAGMETLNSSGTTTLTTDKTLDGSTLLTKTAGTQDSSTKLPPPPTGDTTQDPTTIVAPTATPDTIPPVHIRTQVGNNIQELLNVNIAPDGSALFGGDNFFQVSHNQTFDYFFDLEFFDPGHHGNALDFTLSNGTISALNTQFGARGASTWDFDPDLGHLVITNTGSINTDTSISLDIMAKDLAGNTSGFKTYTLELFNPDQTVAAGTTVNTDSITAVALGNNDVSAWNARIFYTDNSDTITLTGTSNTIHLGGGANMITVANYGNTIFGDHDHDTFILQNGENHIYGMDGDDVFKIDMSSSAAGEIGASGYVLDGGHSSFKAGDQLRANGVAYQHAVGDTGGYGDTLYFENAGGLIDFASSYDQDYFRGIERIDLTSGSNYFLNLTYQDVIDMTDYKNTLIIRADAGDSITFTGFTGMQKTENVLIDDDYATPGNTQTNFDVYTDGTVTLLVQDIGATVTGL